MFFRSFVVRRLAVLHGDLDLVVVPSHAIMDAVFLLMIFFLLALCVH